VNDRLDDRRTRHFGRRSEQAVVEGNMTVGWVVSVSQRRSDVSRTYQGPPRESAAAAHALAAIILGRSQVINDGPWREPIPGGQRTVRVQHTYDGRVF
jgi:hypothetical protein